MRKQILLIPARPTNETYAVADAWAKTGKKVITLARFWEPPELVKNYDVKLYGNPFFCSILAKVLDLELIGPQEDVLLKVDKKWTKRKLRLKKAKSLKLWHFPSFIKPLKAKLFETRMYTSVRDFRENTEKLLGDEEVIVSEYMNMTAEARAFILGNEIVDAAFYTGEGDVEELKAFIQAFITENQKYLSSSSVLDFGYNPGVGWFFLDANEVWSSALHNCSADKIIDCIASATIEV